MDTSPTSVTVKVTIRATPIGARVIQRLDIPNMDKSAEVRRLAELGMAAELAGFSLDGTILRFGGRVWDMQSELEQVRAARSEPAAKAVVTRTPGPNDSDSASGSRASADAQKLSVNGTGESKTDNPGVVESPLMTNLRGLSGG